MGLQTQIWKNNMRVLYLIMLFPVILYTVIYIAFAFSNGTFDPPSLTRAESDDFWGIIILVNIVLLIWLLISIFFQRRLIFAFSGAKPLTRKDNARIYNIVENLSISRWMPVPRLWILEDDSLNAFATGWSKSDSRVVFSRGIINKLNDEELEAVAAHELSHIENNDVKVMVIVTCFIWIVATMGEVLIRSSSGNNKDNKNQGQIILLGLVLLVIWNLVFPLINLALSRRKEYLADAGSVQITKNPQALINALKKISEDSAIESIEKQNIANMCISSPFAKNASGISAKFHEMFSTHPSMENRVKVLEGFL